MMIFIKMQLMILPNESTIIIMFEWRIIISVKNTNVLSEAELKKQEGVIILNKLSKDDF